MVLSQLRVSQIGWYCADDILKCIFWNENIRISIRIWLKFIPTGPDNDKSALV